MNFMNHPSYWALWPDSDRLVIRSFFDGMPLVWGPGKLGDNNVLDLAVEATVRDWIYRHCWWTGTNIPTTDWDAPLVLLQWWKDHTLNNSGEGPEWACASIGVFYVGVLAAYGIYARRVCSVSSFTPCKVDHTAEFWSTTTNSWIFVLPQQNAHFVDHCGSMSFARWCASDRENLPVRTVTVTGNGLGRAIPGLVPLGWSGMSGYPFVARGNSMHVGIRPRTPEAWQFMGVMPKVGSADSALLYPPEYFVPANDVDLESISAPPAELPTTNGNWNLVTKSFLKV